MAPFIKEAKVNFWLIYLVNIMQEMTKKPTKTQGKLVTQYRYIPVCWLRRTFPFLHRDPATIFQSNDHLRGSINDIDVWPVPWSSLKFDIVLTLDTVGLSPLFKSSLRSFCRGHSQSGTTADPCWVAGRDQSTMPTSAQFRLFKQGSTLWTKWNFGVKCTQAQYW